MKMNSLMFCSVALLMLLFSQAAIASPRLELKESEFNFGFVPQNANISHVFWLRSTGDDSLRILNVVPGCGCTKAPLENSELAAGDSTRLEIIFSTRSYSNRVVKSPRIETNEGAPHKQVRIIAQVVVRADSTYPLVFHPYKLDISQFGEKTRNEMKFQITNVSDQALDLSLIDRPEGLFDLELPGSIAAGQTAEGVLRLHDETVELSFEKSITIRVNDEELSRFTLPIKRTLRQPGVAATTASVKGK